MLLDWQHRTRKIIDGETTNKDDNSTIVPLSQCAICLIMWMHMNTGKLEVVSPPL